MPPVQAPTPGYPAPSRPGRLIGSRTLATGFQDIYIVSFQSAVVVVTGIDAVANNASPIQNFFSAGIIPAGGTYSIFYYDSQSTGEGNGVWFSWRGGIPLFNGDELQLNGNSSGQIQWSWNAYGYAMPLKQ